MAHVDDKTSEEESRLVTHILARLGSRVRDLRVMCHNSGVILQGNTRSFHAKQLAQHSVMEICYLPILANEIEVR